MVESAGIRLNQMLRITFNVRDLRFNLVTLTDGEIHHFLRNVQSFPKCFGLELSGQTRICSLGFAPMIFSQP